MDFFALTRALSQSGFLKEKSWRLSPEAWRFSDAQRAELEAIGTASLAFYRALEKLYLASAENKKILRNGNLRAPWVASLLDYGKPQRLIKHQRSRALAGKLPLVIRPDLLLCDDGFALTELDSVPGGIGLTALLSRLYACGNAIPEHFCSAVSRGVQGFVVIAVSDEAESYRTEFEWLARELRAKGIEIAVCHPNALTVSSDAVFLDGKKVDVIYRFFELFDLDNVRDADALFEAVARGKVVVSPPMRPFQEEKMSLALLHHPSLAPFWEEALGNADFALLKKIVPETWIVEPTPPNGLPASSVLLAPTVNGLPIRDWRELASASKRDRDLVLKASGFDETAWGSRSVTVGSDVSQTEWSAALENALASATGKNVFYVLQRFRKPARLEHTLFDENGFRVSAFGRVRICPYYFVVPDKTSRERVVLGGALCTFCPPDKKIIHGMSVAALLPCMCFPEGQISMANCGGISLPGS